MKEVAIETMERNFEELTTEIDGLNTNLYSVVSDLVPNLSIKIYPRDAWGGMELYVEVTDTKVFWSSYMTAYIKSDDLTVNHGSGGYNDGVTGIEILDAEIAINEAVKVLWENREEMLEIGRKITEKQKESRVLWEKIKAEKKANVLKENIKELTNSGFMIVTADEAIKLIENNEKVYAVTDSADEKLVALNAYKKYTGRFYLYDQSISKEDLKTHLENLNIVAKG